MSDRLSGALSPDIAPLERVNISRRAYATTHIVVVRYARELVATQLQVLRCGAGLRRPGILRARYQANGNPYVRFRMGLLRINC